MTSTVHRRVVALLYGLSSGGALITLGGYAIGWSALALQITVSVAIVKW